TTYEEDDEEDELDHESDSDSETLPNSNPKYTEVMIEIITPLFSNDHTDKVTTLRKMISDVVKKLIAKGISPPDSLKNCVSQDIYETLQKQYLICKELLQAKNNLNEDKPKEDKPKEDKPKEDKPKEDKLEQEVKLA